MRKNYSPKTIYFYDGFHGPKPNVGYMMKFSPEKANKIINEIIEKGKKTIYYAEVGLDGDWNGNRALYYSDGKYNKDYNFHQQSYWAIPILIIYYINEPSERYEVWEKID